MKLVVFMKIGIVQFFKSLFEIQKSNKLNTKRQLKRKYHIQAISIGLFSKGNLKLIIINYQSLTSFELNNLIIKSQANRSLLNL